VNPGHRFYEPQLVGEEITAQYDAKLKPKVAVKPAGYHLHRCEHCGTIFGHGSDANGDYERHRCPKCGHGPVKEWNGNWNLPKYTGPAPVNVPQTYAPSFLFQSQNCPT